MALFNVIKYEGDNSTFIWKHPQEDFNIFSQLIVHENQEAIFFKDGEALDLFGPGRYTLKTKNIPLLTDMLRLTTGGRSPFHCEVYFINKTEEMAMKWGTSSRIQYMEPNYHFPLSIGASGEMSLQAADSRKLLLKLVGTEAELGREGLTNYFRAFLMTRIKSYFGEVMDRANISIFELDRHLVEFSDAIKVLLEPDFADYGISLEKFLITTIMPPEGEEQYEKFKELHFRQYADIKEAKIEQQRELINAETEAKKLKIDAKAQAEKRKTEGYTYAQERGFDVAEKVAENEAAGEYTNMGIGLGTMVGVGGKMAEAVSSAMDESMSQNDKSDAFCAECGAKLLPGARFCDKCGMAVNAAAEKCTECGQPFTRPGKFCPKCGAKRPT